jgi:GWxTD domain-containing protein
MLMLSQPMRMLALLTTAVMLLASEHMVECMVGRKPIALAQPLGSNWGNDTRISDTRSFFLDVFCFKGLTDSLQRVDVYSVVPYQSLTFIKKGSDYIGSYTLIVIVKDNSGREVQRVTKDYPLAEERTEVTSGATGAFSAAQTTLYLPAGAYTIETTMSDLLGKRTMTRSRSITTVDFAAYDFSLSSVMFASAIAQQGERYSVTPYLDDDVSVLAGESFFAFFESYFRSLTIDSVDFSYELLDTRNQRVLTGKRTRRFVRNETVQQYIKVEIPQSLPVGNYTLRVLALRPDTTSLYTARSVLAASARLLKIEWKNMGYGTMLTGDELTRAIRQMRYVASQQEVAALLALPTDEEKQRRFYEYWKRLDPTPGTPRNEAYEEYYSRIEFANRNFRHYAEGWQTDMGMVYVVYGPPASASDRPRIDGRTQIFWYYSQFGREFVFIDNGFGDFRLITPAMVTEKYRYRR